MSAIPVPSWAEVREVYESGTGDEWRRYASDAAVIEGVIHTESRAQHEATVRLEHFFYVHPARDDGPWNRPNVVLRVATDSMDEAMLTAGAARRLAAELIAAADRLDGEQP